MKFLELLKYDGIDTSKTETILKERDEKFKTIVQEAFQTPFTSKNEAIDIIEKDLKDNEFVKENLEYVVNKVKMLSEAEFKIIFNTYENGKKVETEKVEDSSELETEGKKKRGRPSTKVVVPVPIKDTVVDVPLKEEIEDAEKTEYNLPTEPDQDDCVITDVSGGGYDVSCESKYKGHFTEFEDAIEYINNWQKKNNYSPNIWKIDDHGGATLINDKGDEIKEGVVKPCYENDIKTDTKIKPCFEKKEDEEEKPIRLKWSDVINSDEDSEQEEQTELPNDEDTIVVEPDPKLEIENGKEEDAEETKDEIADFDEPEEEIVNEPIVEDPKLNLIEIIKNSDPEKVKLISKLIKKDKKDSSEIDVDDLIMDVEDLDSELILQLNNLLSGTNTEDKVIEELPNGDEEIETVEKSNEETPEDEKEEEKE